MIAFYGVPYRLQGGRRRAYLRMLPVIEPFAVLPAI